MPSDPILLAHMAALSVALRARTGTLKPADVDALRDQVTQSCAPDSVLRPAVVMFCEAYGPHRRDPSAVASLGEELERGVFRSMHRPVSGHDRSDLNG